MMGLFPTNERIWLEHGELFLSLREEIIRKHTFKILNYDVKQNLTMQIV